MPDINKPTGLGYQGTWTRKCTQCGHGDLSHFGKMGCLTTSCGCIGFAARDLDSVELELIRNPPKADATKYMGETIESELFAEIHRQRGAPIVALKTQETIK